MSVNLLVRTREEDQDMRTKGIWNRKKNKCRIGEGNATQENSGLDLASKPDFAWSQDLHSQWLLCSDFSFMSLHSLLTSQAGRAQHIVSFLLFLFLVIFPAGTKAEPVPYYCAIFVPKPCRFTSVSCVEVSAGRNTYVLQQSCSPQLWGCQRPKGPFPELVLSFAVASALQSEIFLRLDSTACI